MSISMKRNSPKNHVDVQDADSPASTHAYPCQGIIQTTTRNLHLSNVYQVRNQSSGYSAIAAAVDYTLHLADMCGSFHRLSLHSSWHV